MLHFHLVNSFWTVLARKIPYGSSVAKRVGTIIRGRDSDDEINTRKNRVPNVRPFLLRARNEISAIVGDRVARKKKNPRNFFSYFLEKDS